MQCEGKCFGNSEIHGTPQSEIIIAEAMEVNFGSRISFCGLTAVPWNPRWCDMCITGAMKWTGIMWIMWIMWIIFLDYMDLETQ